MLMVGADVKPRVAKLEGATQSGGIWGQIWGHFERRGTDRGTKKTVHVRRCPLNVLANLLK